MTTLQYVEPDSLRKWLRESGRLGEYVRSVGSQPLTAGYLSDVLGLPPHLEFVARGLAEVEPEATMSTLASIPFFSLCKGLFLPLNGMEPEKVAHLFGFAGEPTLNTAGREALLNSFFEKDLGLSLVQKLSCVLGDPFRGQRSTFRRDSLLRVLESIHLRPRSWLLDRLTVVGDVAVLFAEARDHRRSDPPLTAAEVIETLRFLVGRRVPRTEKFDMVRALLMRCGKLEAYFLAKLLLRNAGFGFQYEGPMLARVLAQHHPGTTEEQILHAMALTDAFHVATLLAEEGAAGLRRVQLQPLVPVRPALASGGTDKLKAFPVWVERKYDGIRFMLHKATDATGSVLCGAYTRNRKDWLELVPGLDASIKMLPAQNAIIDGELYGTVVDLDGARPATVYEVYAALQGDRHKPVNLKYAAFDIVYLNGADLTGLPLSQRRQHLQALVGPLGAMPLMVPMQVAEGHLASSQADVNRLYGHFRSQGYEGIISKTLDGTYALAARDPNWLKRKPEITLDLVFLGAVLSVTSKKTAGAFGSYVIGARDADGGFKDVGDVAGLDQQKDQQVQAMIMRDGLLTGKRIERKSSSGVRPGMDLVPGIVATVRFEGIVRDNVSGELKLRDPKCVALRTDKSAHEADTVKDIEELYLRQRVG